MEKRDPLREVANTSNNEPQESTEDAPKQPEVIDGSSENKENGFSHKPQTSTSADATDKDIGTSSKSKSGKLRLSFLKAFDPLYSNSDEDIAASGTSQGSNPIIEELSEQDPGPATTSPLIDISDDEGNFVDAFTVTENEAAEGQVPEDKNLKLDKSLLKFYTPDKAYVAHKDSDTTPETTSKVTEDRPVLEVFETPTSSGYQHHTVEEPECSTSHAPDISESQIVSAISRKISSDCDIIPTKSKFTITESELENYSILREHFSPENRDYPHIVHQEQAADALYTNSLTSVSEIRNVSPERSYVSLGSDIRSELISEEDPLLSDNRLIAGGESIEREDSSDDSQESKVTVIEKRSIIENNRKHYNYYTGAVPGPSRKEPSLYHYSLYSDSSIPNSDTEVKQIEKEERELEPTVIIKQAQSEELSESDTESETEEEKPSEEKTDKKQGDNFKKDPDSDNQPEPKPEFDDQQDEGQGSYKDIYQTEDKTDETRKESGSDSQQDSVLHFDTYSQDKHKEETTSQEFSEDSELHFETKSETQHEKSEVCSSVDKSSAESKLIEGSSDAQSFEPCGEIVSDANTDILEDTESADHLSNSTDKVFDSTFIKQDEEDQLDKNLEKESETDPTRQRQVEPEVSDSASIQQVEHCLDPQTDPTDQSKLKLECGKEEGDDTSGQDNTDKTQKESGNDLQKDIEVHPGQESKFLEISREETSKDTPIHVEFHCEIKSITEPEKSEVSASEPKPTPTEESFDNNAEAVNNSVAKPLDVIAQCDSTFTQQDEEHHSDLRVDIEESDTKNRESGFESSEKNEYHQQGAEKEDTSISDDKPEHVENECKIKGEQAKSETESETAVDSSVDLILDEPAKVNVEEEPKLLEELAEPVNLTDSQNSNIKTSATDTYKAKMADLSEKLSEQQQENSDLKLQLNAIQQAKASLELEIRQKEEVIIKTQAEALKNEQAYKQEIKQLREKVKENSKLIEKDSSKELEDQLKEAKAREAKAIADLNQRTKDELNYQKIMEEYENTIATRFADYQKLKEEHEIATRHLANIELAFSDVHQKYERTKAIIEGFKSNEEALNAALQDSEKVFKQHEERYESLKAHAKAQIEKSNKEILMLRDKYETDINKLKAIIKRLEIKCSSLEVSLQQKTEECAALSALCDEVTGKKV